MCIAMSEVDSVEFQVFKRSIKPLKEHLNMANPMTVEGEKRLREELVHRKGELRKEIVEAISEARAHGD